MMTEKDVKVIQIVKGKISLNYAIDKNTISLRIVSSASLP